MNIQIRHMFIQIEETPNPHSLKFLPGQEIVSSGTFSFQKSDFNVPSPMANMLFTISGVKSVFITKDFITVTKEDTESWELLKPIVLGNVVDFLSSNQPVVVEVKKEVFPSEFNDEITNQIIELIETKVRPAVAQDGGDITFKGFEDGVVMLEMHGACSGCPSSSLTLKSGIENMLKHYIPEVKEVVAV